MPQKSQDHVHRLIGSMTRAEKRYYKLYVGRHSNEGTTVHEMLFDAIAAMDVYHEPALLTRFKGHAFLKRFAVTKRRLYESILRGLDAYHAESSIDVRLHRSLHYVEILYQRALYDDAEKMLLSVRRLAEENDRTTALLTALEWERRLIECRNYAGATEASLDDMMAAERGLIDRQLEVDTLWDLKSRLLMLLYREGQARDPETQDRVRSMIEHPLLRDPKALNTLKARFLFHHMQGAAAFAMGDIEKCHHHLTANLELLESNRDRFSDEPNLVLGVMSNLIYTCIHRGRYTEAFKLLKSFRTLPSQWNMPESDDLDLKLYSTSTSLELSIHSKLGDFDKAMEMIPVLERGIAKHAERLGPVRKAALQLQAAYTYFGSGEHEKALRWINDLLNNARVDDSSDTVCFGRLLQLIALLEVGKLDLLSYALRNTERFLKQRERSYQFEPLLLHLIRDLMKTRNETERRAILETFRDRVGALRSVPTEQAVFDHFDPIAWADAKLTDRPFAALVKEHAIAVQHAA